MIVETYIPSNPLEFLDKPIAENILSNKSPASPTKGLPCLSSSGFGASPMIITSDAGSPSPKTKFRAPLRRSQNSNVASADFN